MSTLGVGIIGFGRIGNEHARWIAETGNASVAGVFDPTEARREKAAALGLRCARSIDDLFLEPSIDAILISTPTAMHFEQASHALNAGKHVMIEKPMTLDLAQAQKLVGLASEKNRVLSVFHNRRWDVDYLTVKAAIESGIFGRVFNIESRLGQWGSCVGPAAKEWRPNWRNEASYGGGGLYDWGSHFIDQLWQLILPSKPVRVFAQLRGNHWSHDCDDFARVCIDFDNGAVGLVEINTTTTRPPPRWHIDGQHGSAESPFSIGFDTSAWAELTFQSALTGVANSVPRATAGLSEVAIWQRFATACWTGCEPAVSVMSVLPTMRLLDAALASAQSGTVTKLTDC